MLQTDQILIYDVIFYADLVRAGFFVAVEVLFPIV
jgi:hypothetical protein